MIINHAFDIENVSIDFTSVVKANNYITGNCIVHFVDETETTLFFSAKYVEYNSSYSVVVDFDKNEAEQDVKWEDDAKKLVEEILTENLEANKDNLGECALKEEIEDSEFDPLGLGVEDKEERNIDCYEDQIFVAEHLVDGTEDDVIFDSEGVEFVVELEDMPFDKVKETIEYYDPDSFLSGKAYPDDAELEEVFKTIKVRVFINYKNDQFESYLDSKDIIKEDGSFTTSEFYEKCSSNDFYNYIEEYIKSNWNPDFIWNDSDNDEEDTFELYDLI